MKRPERKSSYVRATLQGMGLTFRHLVSTVTTGPLVLSCVLLYVDLRVRVDGLDLRQRAQVAFSRAG